ncbi:hypothetical protein [Engelhardtia mirabilis]|uniref:Uncharacterized protein n=1 Tax=Engelhardtia mirabilis TaxID=2528011 RepID=A0A518BE98_9BACT|nr:hypothetical protein Pla133_02670 [Planctomycetes bacterium Pla133]QDU99529.1 hypothetical protein Pla86_02670 [Planctomycetes bacterium Pla86]
MSNLLVLASLLTPLAIPSPVAPPGQATTLGGGCQSQFTSSEYNGSGVNPDILDSAFGPFIVPGFTGSWDTCTDFSAFTPGSLAILAVGFGATSGIVLDGGEILVDPTLPTINYFYFIGGAELECLSPGITYDPVLCGLDVYAQWVIFDGLPAGYTLTNAIHGTIGSV